MVDSRLTPTPHALPLGAQPLPHEKLDAFRVAVELVEIATAIKSVRGAAGAIDQLRRAATSVALNISEACGREGADRRRFFAMARGSALESAAALRVLLALRVIPRPPICAGATCARDSTPCSPSSPALAGDARFNRRR